MGPDNYTINEQMLPVGEGHVLYVQRWGNKQAERTYLFLHGGPGGGCHDGHKQLFDPSRDNVIFFDQRGSGKSTPNGERKNNTTERLIHDNDTILENQKIDTATIVGGSWGACLALAYALNRPEKVSAMVLRGVFTGTKSEIDHINGGQYRKFFPDVWGGFVERAPAGQRDDPAGFLLSSALSGSEDATASAFAFHEMEGSLISLDDRHRPTDLAAYTPAATQINLHYIQNRCFMPDRHILDNAHKLTMPVWIVQGRYDMICPPITAYELHERLPKSELLFTVAGHSGSDRGNFDAVRSIISSLAR